MTERKSPGLTVEQMRQIRAVLDAGKVDGPVPHPGFPTPIDAAIIEAVKGEQPRDTEP
jgi:hypothetical protein